MIRVESMYLLCVCAVAATLVQPGSAWWWKKQNCPQQEHCPINCLSGYVIDAKDNGCKVQLCRCNDVCEHFNCPENTRCQRKFHCKRWGGCSVYPTCVRTYVQSQSPDETVPETTKIVTRKTTVTPPSTTTTGVPTTTKTATTTTLSGGEAITKKTAVSILCPDSQEPLQGWNCDVTLLRGRPCPTNYRCENRSSGGVAICCPAPVTSMRPPQPTRATPRPTGQDPVFTERPPIRSYCSDGKPHLAGWQCGRGGTRCPSTHKCLIHPADRYAVCCPIPVQEDEPSRTPVSRPSLPICEKPAKAGSCKANLPRWHFDSNTGLCEFFRYGGCEGNANNFRSVEACERSCGGPGESYCSLPAEVGRCRAAFRRYYYDETTRECTQFIYGGCEGNGNNFATIEQCQNYCNRY